LKIFPINNNFPTIFEKKKFFWPMSYASSGTRACPGCPRRG